MLFNTLALISLLIIITLLKRLVSIYPSLMACMIRWKENVNLQMSVKLSTDRNLLALSMIIPFCLTVYRFGLYRPEFMAEMDEAAGVGVTIGIFTAYILTRRLCYIMARPRKASQTMYRTSASASYTFFIILALLLLATGGVLSFFDVNPDMIKTDINKFTHKKLTASFLIILYFTTFFLFFQLFKEYCRSAVDFNAEVC